ncbi:MAG: PH domain-containing protein [Candidatus Nanohalobium sp.]
MKLSKASIPYRALKDIGTLIAVVVFSGKVSFQTLNPAFFLTAVLGFVGFISVSLIWEYVVWMHYDYFFDGDSLRITHGVLRRNERDIPYRRIQNVNIKRNIVHRALKVAKVDFETAGGSEVEASLKYVSEDQARDIQDRVRRFKKSGSEEKDGEREEVFELSERDLLAYSLLSLNGRAVVILLGAFSLVAGVVGGFIDGLSIAPMLLFSFVGLGLFLGSWFVNAAWNYLQYYDFRLWLKDDTLEYERGLLNRSEGSIPLEKVQGLSFRENALMRRFDFATLSVESAGGLGGGQEKGLNGNRVAVPLAARSEVFEFGKRLEEFSDFDLERIPGRARKRYMGRYGVAVLLLTAAGFVVDSVFFSFSYWVLLLLLPLVFVAAHLKWVNKGFEVQEDYFVAVNGFWRRSISVTPYYRVQNLIQTEGVFQRRWGLSSVMIDTAGSGFTRDAWAVDLDSSRASEVREEVFRRFKASLKR